MAAITEMPFFLLNQRLEVAMENEKYWQQQLTRQPESDKIALTAQSWTIRRRQLIEEYERRADILPLEVLMYLIDSCENFSLTDNP